METKPLLSFKRKKSGKPVFISGPCSAESEKQMLDTAKALVKSDIDWFRAGIWKPRTRPSCFEGVGLKGLHWMNQIQQKYRLKVMTEVATTAHVEACLEMNIDALWIGARTCTNPFSVQEIANAIRGTGIPVLIKNPMNPDIALWMGAIERIIASGSNEVAAIHRGFPVGRKGKFRNAPMWEIPIELKRLMPGIPILCDPSHICGNRSLLQEVSQKAMDLSFTGLMVESHIAPDQALSDAEQQLTPIALRKLLNSLVIRHPATDNVMLNVALNELRGNIDQLDEELIFIIRQRTDLVEKIAEYKKENNIAILQEDRWADIIESRQQHARELGLSPDLFLKIFQYIHEESIRLQTEIMNRYIYI